MNVRATGRVGWVVAVACLSVTGSACDVTSDPGSVGAVTGTSGPRSPGELRGVVTLDGSSTVLPVSMRVAGGFQKANPRVEVKVENSGTGGGFKKFCAGQIDITGASRPINASELKECRANSVEFIELPFAFDSVSVIVNARNTFVDCLKVSELKRIWEPAAQGKVTRWNQLRSTFPDQPLVLFGPGHDSGTFDYFTLAIVGTESSSRVDYTKSEGDSVLGTGVGADVNALGYFGYAYYAAHPANLKLVSIDSGSGCVAPDMETVAENRYQPLSRPLFIYVSKAAARRPEVRALAHYYVAPENARFALEVGYLPLPTVTLLWVSRRLDTGVTGSIFGGRGSVIGVTADTFQDEDKVKNALVR